MNDLISRQAAINVADRADYTGLAIEDVKKVTDEVVKELKQIPAADVVKVVRCKDCKWWKSIYSWNGKEHKVCVREPYEPPREADDYCSYGERREE